MKIKDIELLAEESIEKFDRYESIYGEHGALCFAVAWITMKRYLGYEEKVDMAYCHGFAIALHSLIEEEELEPELLFSRYCVWFSDMIDEGKFADALKQRPTVDMSTSAKF